MRASPRRGIGRVASSDLPFCEKRESVCFFEIGNQGEGFIQRKERVGRNGRVLLKEMKTMRRWKEILPFFLLLFFFLKKNDLLGSKSRLYFSVTFRSF